jgi:L-asparaginase II
MLPTLSLRPSTTLASWPRFSGRLEDNRVVLPKGKLVVAALRGDQFAENHWVGSGVIVSAKGNVVNTFGGDGSDIIKARSSIKPLHAAQLIKLIEQQRAMGKQVPEISSEEWAVLTASHGGTPEHVAHVESAMRKFGINEKQLISGAHMPLDKVSARELILKGLKPTHSHHQCSGHHTALQIYAKLSDIPGDDYWKTDSKLQTALLGSLQKDAGKEPLKLVSYDKCNIPTTSLSMKAMAQLYAKMMSDPDTAPLLDAMTRHPHLVADHEAFDTQLMKLTKGNLVAKLGADGLLCVGNRLTEEAMVVKIWSGSAGSAGEMRDRTAIQTLLEAGWITPKIAQTLRNNPVFNEVPGIHPLDKKPLVHYMVEAPLWDKPMGKGGATYDTTQASRLNILS